MLILISINFRSVLALIWFLFSLLVFSISFTNELSFFLLFTFLLILDVIIVCIFLLMIFCEAVFILSLELLVGSFWFLEIDETSFLLYLDLIWDLYEDCSKLLLLFLFLFLASSFLFVFILILLKKDVFSILFFIAYFL